jgi:tetratricopeptide (TPR) repeat protein
MAKRSATEKAVKPRMQSFAELSSPGGEFSALRAEYARQTAKKRRAAADWVYHESIGTQLFGAAIARLGGENPFAPKWPAGFAALAIDPEYAPALLTVGCHEYSSGLEADGMGLLLQLTGLPPETPDLIVGMGWALCRSHQTATALPWLKKAIANAPAESSVHNDYGWALIELGRLDEAERALEKAVGLASPNDDLAANNLRKLRQLQRQHGRVRRRKSNQRKR